MSQGSPRFDWTINLGHVLTFLGFIVTGFMGFQHLDKRVVVLEQIAQQQAARDAAQDQAARDARADVREALKDVQRTLERLDQRLQDVVRGPRR